MEAKSVVLILFIVKTSLQLSREYNPSPYFESGCVCKSGSEEDIQNLIKILMRY
jgi:hypothetical protein